MNKEWKFDGEAYFLYFSPYIEEIKCAGITEFDGKWIISSKQLNIEYDTLVAKSLKEAKEETEELIIDYFKDEINYWEYLLCRFEEE